MQTTISALIMNTARRFLQESRNSDSRENLEQRFIAVVVSTNPHLKRANGEKRATVVSVLNTQIILCSRKFINATTLMKIFLIILSWTLFMVAFIVSMTRNDQLQLYDLCVNQGICTTPTVSTGNLFSKSSLIQLEGYRLTKNSSVTFVGVGKDIAIQLPRMLKQASISRDRARQKKAHSLNVPLSLVGRGGLSFISIFKSNFC
jgi:hypothetical protein